MLQSVVDEVLFVSGKHNAVDLARRPWLDQFNSLVHLREP